MDQQGVGAAHRRPAEFDSIDAVLGRLNPDRVHHVLLHTDTVVGRAAADVVLAWLRDRGHTCKLLTAPGLRTDDMAAFKEALGELTARIDDYAKYRDSEYQIVFNLTGSFKSLTAYVQALGMIVADRCVFLFEGAKELMEIPRLPVRLADLEEIRENLGVFRRLAKGYSVRATDTQAIADALLLEFDGEVQTSLLGYVAWNRAKPVLYAEQLLPALSTRLRIRPGVEAAFRKLPADRKRQLNDALDALSARHDAVCPPLKSETIKPLQGNPRPPSTHEMYAWSDGDAAHHEGECLVVDALGEHL